MTLHRFAALTILLLTAVAVIAQAPPKTTFTTTLSFDGTNGVSPNYMSLIQGTDGDFYGTTVEGGTYGYGTIFKITSAGTITTLHSFCAKTNSSGDCTDGDLPYAGLLLATNGYFYGVTPKGGSYGEGTAFKMSSSGTLTTLHSFCKSKGCPDGSAPYGALIEATNGYFYGTTAEGGSASAGTVFKMGTSGTVTTLYNFCSKSGCTDGENPYSGLIQATDGNFYGTTFLGGKTYNKGIVFKITTAGVLTTLHAFGAPDDGTNPNAGLVQATNGDLYGTAAFGGNYSDGTVFQITTAGTLTTLYSFCKKSSCSDGQWPYASLVQATDGYLYGTTVSGGTKGYGTAFKISTSGTLTTLHDFVSTDGEEPYGGVLQSTNGTFYGSTFGGGKNSEGTLFSIATGLASFVTTSPISGKVKASVTIFGTDLTGASSVTFDGTTATYKVVSATEITTTVPAGATTGTVKVKTSAGTLDSNVVYTVTK